MVRYVLLWFPLMVIGVGNGILRGLTYGPHLSELRAHQLSSVLGVVLIGGGCALALRFAPPRSARHAWAIGALWTTMTVSFEFGFGRFVAGHSWARLMGDYNVLSGRLWCLVLLTILVVPPLFHLVVRSRKMDESALR